MANLAQAMKEEIARIAQREVRREMSQPKKQQSQHRRDIAALKRRINDLEKQLAIVQNYQQKRQTNEQSQMNAVMSALAGQPAGSAPAAPAARVKTTGRRKRRENGPRFQPRGLRTHRNKLGLTAEEYGRLIGVSGQSIYAWENEKTRPRQKQIEALAEVRKLSKRQAQRQLESSQSQLEQSSGVSPSQRSNEAPGETSPTQGSDSESSQTT